MKVIVQLTFEVKQGRDAEFHRLLDELVASDRAAGFPAQFRLMHRVLPQAANDGMLSRLMGTTRMTLVPTMRQVVELTWFHEEDYERANNDRDRGHRWQEAFALGSNAAAALTGVQILQTIEPNRLRAVAS